MMKLFKPLLAALGLAALGTASANVDPAWITADFNGNGQQDAIYTSNLADVVFNPQGEIIGWYVKVAPGKSLIDKKDGKYDFSQLKTPKNGVAESLLGTGNRRALTLSIPGVTGDMVAQAPQLNADVKANRLTAVFRYTQGAATVTKTVTLHPRQFNMQAEFNVTGADGYTVNFPGLGSDATPLVKVVGADGQLREGAQGAAVPNIQYAGLQDAINHGLFFVIGSNTTTASALLVRPQPGTAASATTTVGQNASLSLGLRGDAKLDVYGGKNELIHLYQEGYTKLPGVFEPNIFGQLSLLVVKFMEWLHGFMSNWGLVILVLTVALRLVIWPLMQAQGRTTAKMQLLQPMLKEAQEKYKDDPQKMQAETMRLYRDYNVNPAGCLSMLVPFPILIALYSTIRNFEFDSGFLWLPDLSIPDPLYILAALYVLANLLNLYVATRKTPQMFKQQSVLYLVFAYFALTFPAGVTLYWIISTLIGAGQQYLINQQVAAHMSGGLQKVERVSKPGRAVAAAGTVTTTATVKPTISKASTPKLGKNASGNSGSKGPSTSKMVGPDNEGKKN